MPCPPTFFSLGFVFGEVFKYKSDVCHVLCEELFMLDQGCTTFLWQGCTTFLYRFSISKDKHVPLHHFDRWTCTLQFLM